MDIRLLLVQLILSPLDQRSLLLIDRRVHQYVLRILVHTDMMCLCYCVDDHSTSYCSHHDGGNLLCGAQGGVRLIFGSKLDYCSGVLGT